MQSRIVNSEFFHNVQFEIYPNGSSAQIMNETEKFNSGSAYSPLELFGDNEHAKVLLMHEQSTLRGYDFYKALINDSVYSNASFKANIHKINCLAQCLPNDFKNIHLNFIDMNKLPLSVNVSVKNLYHAAKLGKAYAKLNNLEYVGYTKIETGDHILKRVARDLRLKHLSLLTKDVIKKEYFTLPDSGKGDQPFESLHYWQWLKDSDYNGTQDIILTKINYLVSLGFNKGLHKLDDDEISILKYTQDHYYYKNFVKNKNKDND